jgi:hypothetical protein
MSSLTVKLLSASGRLLNSQTGLAGALSVRDYSHLTRNSEGRFNCTLIPGDGVGPELVSCF